jgi:hypothetical protein
MNAGETMLRQSTMTVTTKVTKLITLASRTISLILGLFGSFSSLSCTKMPKLGEERRIQTVEDNFAEKRFFARVIHSHDITDQSPCVSLSSSDSCSRLNASV